MEQAANLKQAQTLTSFKSGCWGFLSGNDEVNNHTAFMKSRHFVIVFFYFGCY